MKFFYSAILLVSLQFVAPLFAGTATAQNGPDAQPALPPDFVFDDTTQKGFQSLTSALTVLTTDDSVTGGRFTLDPRESDSDEADIDVLKLWNEIPLLSEDQLLVPLLELSFSYLKFEQQAADGGGEAEIDNWALGAGLGLRINLLDELLQITPRIKAEYAEYDFDVRLADFDQSLLNSIIPDIEALTYLPSLQVQLQPELNTFGSRCILGTNLSYVYVDANSSKSSLSDFTSESWVWRNSLAAERSFTFGEHVDQLYLRPQLARVDLYGDARDGFELNNFYEAGIDIFSRQLLSSIFSELGIGFRYVFEDRIQGWRLGLFGDLS